MSTDGKAFDLKCTGKKHCPLLTSPLPPRCLQKRMQPSRFTFDERSREVVLGKYEGPDYKRIMAEVKLRKEKEAAEKKMLDPLATTSLQRVHRTVPDVRRLAVMPTFKKNGEPVRNGRRLRSSTDPRNWLAPKYLDLRVETGEEPEPDISPEMEYSPGDKDAKGPLPPTPRHKDLKSCYFQTNSEAMPIEVLPTNTSVDNSSTTMTMPHNGMEVGRPIISLREEIDMLTKGLDSQHDLSGPSTKLHAPLPAAPTRRVSSTTQQEWSPCRRLQALSHPPKMVPPPPQSFDTKKWVQLPIFVTATHNIGGRLSLVLCQAIALRATTLATPSSPSHLRLKRSPGFATTSSSHHYSVTRPSSGEADHHMLFQHPWIVDIKVSLTGEKHAIGSCSSVLHAMQAGSCFLTPASGCLRYWGPQELDCTYNTEIALLPIGKHDGAPHTSIGVLSAPMAREAFLLAVYGRAAP